MNQYATTYDASDDLAVEQTFVTKTFGWMAFALVITGIIAYYVGTNPELLKMIFVSPAVFWGLLIFELALVFGLSAFINRMSASTATGAFIVYAVVNGITMSVIFLAFASAQIYQAFLITSGTFGAMALYGYYTKRDLTGVGSIARMALIGLIIASVVNIFWQNPSTYWIINYVGVLVFVALTAYDAQKIKQIGAAGFGDDTEVERKAAILGALALYLDFINLFLFILRIMGGRRN